MMKYFKYGMLFVLASWLYVSEAPPLNAIAFEYEFEAADTAYKNKDYYKALEWYNQVYREERQNKYLHRVAELYYILRDYKRAERWLERLIARDDENQYPVSRLHYAKVLKMNGKYDDYAIHFQELIQGRYKDFMQAIAKVELETIDQDI